MVDMARDTRPGTGKLGRRTKESACEGFSTMWVVSVLSDFTVGQTKTKQKPGLLLWVLHWQTTTPRTWGADSRTRKHIMRGGQIPARFFCNSGSYGVQMSVLNLGCWVSQEGSGEISGMVPG